MRRRRNPDRVGEGIQATELALIVGGIFAAYWVYQKISAGAAAVGAAVSNAGTALNQSSTGGGVLPTQTCLLDMEFFSGLFNACNPGAATQATNADMGGQNFGVTGSTAY